MSLPVNWHLGTIGFGYPDWSGTFYPRGLDGAVRLAHYARSFDIVELDTTFHALPAPQVVRAWRDAVPAAFSFAAKAPRQVTHEESPAAPEVAEAMLAFVDRLGELGERLVCILLQYPPRFQADQRRALATFLQRLPPGPRYAVEFRDRSWWTAETAALLRDAGAAWVAADEAPRTEAGLSPDDLYPGAHRPPPAVLTADFLYLRWIGVHQQFPDVAVERLDPTPRLDWWRRRVEAILARPEAASVTDVYGLFGNGFSGHGPASCRHLQHLLGRAPAAPAPPLEQGTLFT